jgi:hypothetical protein
MKVTGMLHAPAALSLRISIGHLSDKRLCSLRAGLDVVEERKISCLLAEIKFEFYVLTVSMKIIHFAGWI